MSSSSGDVDPNTPPHTTPQTAVYAWKNAQTTRSDSVSFKEIRVSVVGYFETGIDPEEGGIVGGIGGMDSREKYGSFFFGVLRRWNRMSCGMPSASPYKSLWVSVLTDAARRPATFSLSSLTFRTCLTSHFVTDRLKLFYNVLDPTAISLSDRQSATWRQIHELHLPNTRAGGIPASCHCDCSMPAKWNAFLLLSSFNLNLLHSNH